MNTTALIWFTTNLRLHDNETLVKAIAENNQVVPVFCLDDGYFGIGRYGCKKIGGRRANFLLEALMDLDLRLRSYASGLIIVKGDTPLKIAQLAKHYCAKTIYAQKEFAPEELNTQKAVKNELSKQGAELITVASGNLYNDDELPFALHESPDIFTIYRKAVEKYCGVPGFASAPAAIPSPAIEPCAYYTLAQLGLEEPAADPRRAIAFKGGETAALKRLNHYLFGSQSVLTYKQTRNGLLGADYSSKFSPWLAMGCLSPRKIYHELKAFERQYAANESTYWLVFELLWRNYFRLVMKKYGTRLFSLSGIKKKGNYKVTHNPHLLNKWKNGQTGVDFIDANMLELKYTGFMSNRGRQNVASYLCNDLLLDWRYGAAYFQEQLIDYDVCSNFGNWAYIAGAGNDPRPNRYFNIDKQASEYDADKTYRNVWLQTI